MRTVKPFSVLVRIAVLLLVCVNTLPSVARDWDGDSAIKVSQHPQLFLDNWLISRLHNLKREVQQPVKHPANPLVVQEFPWEKRMIEVYGTILFEPDLGKFRMWYVASEDPDAKPEYYICYAESRDGIRWKKPLIGPVEMPGYEKHNVVIPGGHGICVLHSRHENNPAKKYLGLGGRDLAWSPDGIQWEMGSFESAGKNDTSSSVAWWSGEYLAYVRNQVPDKNWPAVMRGVALSVSKDFRHWTPKKTIVTTDKQDGYPWTQTYSMAATAYGDQLIGLLSLLHLDRIQGNNSLGDMDLQLVTSRDGRSWKRVADRAVFLKPTPDTWDRGRIMSTATTMFVKDDQVYIYYTGDRSRHGEKWGRPGIGLATLPADRFVALRPEKASTAGILTTKLLRINGTKLVVNADLAAQDLQVELLDETGKVFPGYDRNRSQVVTSDKLRFEVKWADEKDFSSLKNRPIALRFILRRGALYSFQITK